MTASLQPSVTRFDADPAHEIDGVRIWTTVCHERQGCLNLEQRLASIDVGGVWTQKFDRAQDVAFVVSGKGRAVLEEREYVLKAGMGFLAPEGKAYALHNDGNEALVLVSVLSPRPGHPSGIAPAAKVRPPGRLTLDERVVEGEAAGVERRFKVMINPRLGAKYVTQFIGEIEKSKAPAHKHTYEEVIYILEGRGVMHLDQGDFPVEPGSCIYLPAGSMHCLENLYDQPIRLLGVFCPAGSPANRAD